LPDTHLRVPAATQPVEPRADSRWWQETTIYEIYPRSFFDSNGDGIGDLPGIVARLDYLRDLGVETLWIAPFFASPQADFGYDITDYLSVAPEYGTLEDVDCLISEAHARGLKVLFDLVLNHTSDQHPWFVESRSSRTNPKHDWYVWADGRGRRKPNNWRAANLTASAWNWSPERGQYYLASFLPFQPDLNYHNPEVKRRMLDVVRFWLRRGVDGFRLDMFGSVIKDAQLRSNPRAWLPFLAEGAVPEVFTHRYDLNTDDGFRFAQEIRAVCDEFADPERVLVGEVFGPPAGLRRFVEAGISLVFLFDFLRFRYRAEFFRRRIAAYERTFPAPLLPTYVLSNHDRIRSASRVGGDLRKAGVLAVLLLTLRGVPTLYMGEEIGMTNTRVPLGRARDPIARRWAFLPEPLVHGLERLIGETVNRDEVRSPMQWDATAHAGFCPDDVEPWLPVNENRADRSVAAQNGDPDSLLSLHRRLLRLRRERLALRGGDLELLRGLPKDVLGYRRKSGLETVGVYLNFASGRRTVPTNGLSDLLLSTARDNRLAAGQLELAPSSAAIVGSRLPSNGAA
jgi:alpha-glucosidase